jgi:TrmH family RNA methyltransferase
MNIGAACRALKNMGIPNLTLVGPRDPHSERSRVMAHGAEDVLDRARIVMHPKDAVRHMIAVAGTTARRRELRKWDHVSPRECAEILVKHAEEGPVGVFFGTERTGLTNEEIDECRYLTMVDTDDAHSSLNLAQAVMVYAYEIREAWRRANKLDVPRRPSRPTHPHRTSKTPTNFELDTMYAHLGQLMTAVEYSDHERDKFLTFLKQMHMRAGIVNWEMQIYHLLSRKSLRALGEPRFQLDRKTDEETS